MSVETQTINLPLNKSPKVSKSKASEKHNNNNDSPSRVGVKERKTKPKSKAATKNNVTNAPDPSTAHNPQKEQKSLATVPAAPCDNKDDVCWDNDDNAITDETLDFDQNVEFHNEKIANFIAQAAAMLVMENEKKKAPIIRTTEKQAPIIRATEKQDSMMIDNKKHISKTGSKQSSKEVLKVSTNALDEKQDAIKNSSSPTGLKDQETKTAKQEAKNSKSNKQWKWCSKKTTEKRQEQDVGAEPVKLDENPEPVKPDENPEPVKPDEKPDNIGNEKPVPVKSKKRGKKAKKPSKHEPEPAIVHTPYQVETVIVEATGQNENIIANFSTKKRRPSKKLPSSKKRCEDQCALPDEANNNTAAPKDNPLTPPVKQELVEPEPVVKKVTQKNDTDSLPKPFDNAPTADIVETTTTVPVPVLPQTASEVSISTTGSHMIFSYPPVATIGAKMGNQFEVLKFLVEVQNYINHMGYHHHCLGQPKIQINSRDCMKIQMETAHELIHSGLPIKSLHAAVLAVYFTNCLDTVERFPIYFRSHVSTKEYKHIVLGIFVQGNFGALGISRDCGLQDKPANYAKLSDLIFEFARCYGHSGHILNEVHFGNVISHNQHSLERLFTKNFVVPVCGYLHSEIEKNVEKFAKQLRTKMGRACLKSCRVIEQSSFSSSFNKKSRTDLKEYSLGGKEKNCANICLRVLSMELSVHLLDTGVIKMRKRPAKKK